MGAALLGGTLASLGGIGEAAADPTGCKRNGKHCTKDTQCCSGDCDSSGTCVGSGVGCGQPSDFCQRGSDCCSGHCRATDNQCCIFDREPCTSSDQCCSSPCFNGICQCLPQGSTCTSGDPPCCLIGGFPASCINGRCSRS